LGRLFRGVFFSFFSLLFVLIWGWEPVPCLARNPRLLRIGLRVLNARLYILISNTVHVTRGI
jgi:hypothetical protein